MFFYVSIFSNFPKTLPPKCFYNHNLFHCLFTGYFMRDDYLMIGVISGISAIVLIIFGYLTCGVTCVIGIPLGIVGLIFFILAFTSSEERAFPAYAVHPGYAMPPPRVCPACGRPIHFYAQVCQWCGYDFRISQYPGPPPQQPPQQPPQPPPCPKCDSAMRFVYEYGRWYCDECRKYA